MRVVTVEQMRSLEQAAVDRGVSLNSLQRNAASAIAGEIEQIAGSCRGPLLFLVGPGNNGRDGLIAAEMLLRRGWTVRVYLAPRAGSEDVLDDLRRGGAEIKEHDESTSPSTLESMMSGACAVVDGLLGIGIRGAVREPMGGIIVAADALSASQRVPVIAIDLPSGIEADSGEVTGAALHAAYTVSLGAVKAGLLKMPAAEYVGKLLTVGIGLPAGLDDGVGLGLLDAGDVAGAIPSRSLNAHKNSFGRVLVVAGSRDFVGAPFFAGCAAARAGCGLVTLAVPEWQRAPLATLLPEATYLPLHDWETEGAAEANLRSVSQFLPSCTSMVIGPGLGQGNGRTDFVRGVLEAAARDGIAAVVDADGLNALAKLDKWWSIDGLRLVVTPHPGEMSRLSKLPSEKIATDRWQVAADMAALWRQAVVLKGAFTVVASPHGERWVSPAALPALATAGTGDVLSGLIAGLMAQGADPTGAARAGVYLHAEAARELLVSRGVDRLIAGDLMQTIPTAIARTIAGRRGG